MAPRLFLPLFFALTLWPGARTWAGPKIAYQRSDILTQPARKHAWIKEPWGEIKRGHLEAVLEVLALHPEKEIYFLARDAEHLYDTARLLLKNQPERLAKMHLLAAGRFSIDHPNFGAYLAQEGINKAALRSGKKILFVDTAYNGSIGTAIQKKFPDSAASFDQKLMRSTNPDIPGTRVFFSAHGKGGRTPVAAADRGHQDLANEISRFERDIPHATPPFESYEKVNGRWTAISDANNEMDGLISRQAAAHYQEDLRAYVESPETQRLIQERQKFWSDVQSTGGTRSGNALKRMLTDPNERAIAKDLVYDWIEHLERSGKTARARELRKSLGLPPAAWDAPADFVFLPSLIPDLLRSRAWDQLRAEVLSSPRYQTIVQLNRSENMDSLTPKERAQIRDITLDWLRSAPYSAAADFARFGLPQGPYGRDMEVLQILAQRNDQKGLLDLANHVTALRREAGHSAKLTRDLDALVVELAKRGDHRVAMALMPWGLDQKAWTLNDEQLQELLRIIELNSEAGEINPVLIEKIERRLAFEARGRVVTRIRQSLGVRKTPGASGCPPRTLAPLINLLNSRSPR